MRLNYFRMKRCKHFRSLFRAGCLAIVTLSMAFCSGSDSGDWMGAAQAEETMHKLSTSEKALFIRTDFQSIKSTKNLPRSVAEELGLTKSGNDMADPDKPWSAGCSRLPNQAGQRLIFAGRSQERCFIFFERGGIAHFFCLQLYQLAGDKAELIWQTYANKPYTSVDEIKEAMKKDELH